MTKPEPIKLKPNPNCKNCLGRGYLRIIRHDLDANKFREIRPCHCVKAVVRLEDAGGEATQNVVWRGD